MNISVSSTQLLEGMTLISKIPAKHPSMPLLAYVQMRVTGDVLELSAFGIGQSARVTIPIVNKGESARILVDHETLSAFLSQAGSGDVGLEEVEHVLVCTIADNRAEIKTIPADTAQEFTYLTQTPWYVGNSVIVGDLLKRVTFACAQSDIRPELASIYVAARDGMLIAAATDSFSLAESKTPAATSEDMSILVPNRYTPEILRIIGNSSKLSIVVGDGVVQFECGDAVLVVRTVAGSYPQYEQIIPREFRGTMDTLAADVRSALRTVIPFTDRQFPKITLQPDMDESVCRCVTEYGEKGHGRSSFRALLDGELFEVRVNADNIIKILSALGTERVVFSLVDPGKPIVVTSPDDASFRALMMPLGR